MAASEKLKSCSACGNKCRFTDRICGTCGENVSAKTSINDKPVMINVGIIRAAEYNELSLVKGSKLPVQVRKGFDADQVLKSAVKKHADCDQHFTDIESYCLMYLDIKIVDVVPGTPQIYCSKLQRGTGKTTLKDGPAFMQSSQC